MLLKLFTYAPVQLFSAVSIFALISIHTKYLTIVEYGMLSLIFLSMEVVRAVAAQWINASMLRLLPEKNKQDALEYAGLSLLILLLCTLPAFVLISVCLYLVELLTLKIQILTFVLFFSKALYFFYLDYTRLNERASLFKLAAMVQALLVICISWLLLHFNADMSMAIYGIIISHITGAIILFSRLPLQFQFLKTDNCKALCSYGLPLMLSGVILSIYSRIDRYFIAEYLDLAQTGVFAALANIVLGIGALLFTLVALPSYPELSKKAHLPEQLQIAHGQYLSILLAVTLPAFVGFSLLAESIIPVLLSQDYMPENSAIIYVLCASVFLLNLKGHYIDHGLQFTLTTKYLVHNSVFTLALNILCIVLLLPTFGLLGAALAGLCANGFAILFSFIVAKRRGYKFNIPIQVLKITIATGVMLISLLFLKPIILQLNLSPYIALTCLIALGGGVFVTVLILQNIKRCLIWWGKYV
ncbi:lipopolysaccharide biosynthesis protein [Pseudoalteromonas sp. MMG010]|uniref:lipopolysaccharide biosynthesis protein n=1 Tax=Pseudoalteromonas sp. MMG010 TaxID=2822685 RepID=UPI001B39DED9|nr:lipopolysaccharide biosynthesis protein [Pseudoalteromonas sp. MMG010]MBQ4834144.1 lipopolysaccharide biosynthesis protein [Pseudoalteromonas sp. MMG010]